MFYVYFLFCDDKIIYTGYTANLKRRISEHKAKKVKSTSRYAVLQLMGYEAYIYKSDAMRREKFLKTSEGKRLLRKQYRDIIQSHR